MRARRSAAAAPGSVAPRTEEITAIPAAPAEAISDTFPGTTPPRAYTGIREARQARRSAGDPPAGAEARRRRGRGSAASPRPGTRAAAWRPPARTVRGPKGPFPEAAPPAPRRPTPARPRRGGHPTAPAAGQG